MPKRAANRKKGNYFDMDRADKHQDLEAAISGFLKPYEAFINGYER